MQLDWNGTTGTGLEVNPEAKGSKKIKRGASSRMQQNPGPFGWRNLHGNHSFVLTVKLWVTNALACS